MRNHWPATSPHVHGGARAARSMLWLVAQISVTPCGRQLRQRKHETEEEAMPDHTRHGDARFTGFVAHLIFTP